jgi:hypothetical protein
VGAGWFGSVQQATRALVQVDPAAAPGPDAERFVDAHRAFRELYPALAPTFHRQKASS